MAGDWIKFETVTPDKHEVHQIADLLEIDPDAVVGKLLRVWIWANQQTVNGNAPGVTKSLIDRITYVTGFADAMVDVNWLSESNGTVTFVNFERHNGNTAKTRAQSKIRTESHRKSKQTCNATSVTDALPEKRREEKSNSISASKQNGEVVIPAKMQTPEVREAARFWFQHLEIVAPDKIPPDDSPQMEAFWSEASRAGPEKFVDQVNYCVARGWKNLRDVDEGKTNGRKSANGKGSGIDPVAREQQRLARLDAKISGEN